jgi:LPS export ABC transporter protein LptC
MAVVSLRNSLAIALLSAAALASWYWSRQPPVSTLRRTSAGETAGYYLRGARMIGTDENGDIRYRIHADRLAEQQDTELLEMQGVRIEYLSPARGAWSISADRATSPKDRSVVDLEGSVAIDSRPERGSALSIKTTKLRFEPATAMVQTAAPVNVELGALRVAANGLRAHLNDDKLELESGVHGKLAR